MNLNEQTKYIDKKINKYIHIHTHTYIYIYKRHTPDFSRVWIRVTFVHDRVKHKHIPSCCIPYSQPDKKWPAFLVICFRRRPGRFFGEAPPPRRQSPGAAKRVPVSFSLARWSLLWVGDAGRCGCWHGSSTSDMRNGSYLILLLYRSI